MKNILLIIGLLISFTTFAGQEKGGGMVIKVQNRYSLFDFFEHGLESNAALSQTMHRDEWNIAPYLTAALNNDPEIGRAISNKLYDIFNKNTHFGWVLYREFFSQYSLKIVNSELLETKDIGSSPVVPPAGSVIYQGAMRDDRERIVWINSQLWSKLSIEHKAGLIFHEAIYALFVLKRGDRSSSSSRALTAYVFDPSFDHQTPRSFHLRLAGYFSKLFLNKTRVRTNEEAEELDLVNDFAKLKNEALEHAAVFDRYGRIFEERFNNEVKKLLSSTCKKDKLFRGYHISNVAKLKFFMRTDVEYNNQFFSPIAYQLGSTMTWSCITRKGITGKYHNIEGYVQIVTTEEMNILKPHTDRLLEIREKLYLYDDPQHNMLFLKDDPKFESILKWISDPKSNSYSGIEKWDGQLVKYY